MKCPIDDTQLAITERQGVEIDYCPQCRGVWLDRGELDKIIEKADAGAPRRDEHETRRRDDDDDHYRSREHDEHRRPDHDDYRRDDHHDHHRKKKHNEGFLGEFFDF